MTYKINDFVKSSELIYGNIYLDVSGNLLWYLGETENGEFKFYPLFSVKFCNAKDGFFEISHESHIKPLAEKIVFDMIRKKTVPNQELLEIHDSMPNLLIGHLNHDEATDDFPAFVYIYEDRKKIKKNIAL